MSRRRAHASSRRRADEPASGAPKPPVWRRDALGFIAIAALCFAAYYPSLRGELLWDDPAHVTRPELRSLEGLGRIFFEFGATQEYYPVLHGAFWLQYQLWGPAPAPYHVTNILLHALNACLLALLLRRLSRVPPGPGDAAPPILPAGAPWAAAILFAVHPVCVESVAWITEQKNTLSTAFYLGSALLYFRFAHGRSRLIHAAAFVLFLLALGAKTMTVTLPAALLVVLWWRHGTLGWRRDLLPLVPWFAASLIAGLVTKWFEGSWVGADVVVDPLSPWQHVLLAARIFWFSLGKLLWPTHLTFFYERWDVPAESAGWIVYLLAALAVTAGLWAIRSRWRGPLAAWLLYGGTLFPVLGFFNIFSFSFAYVADHYQYLAIPVVVSAVAAGFIRLASGGEVVGRAARVLGPAVLLLLGGYSFVLSGHYVNDETLFRANIASNPHSWMGHHILAIAVDKKPGDHREEVLALHRRALELNPDNPDSHYKLGLVLVREPETRAEGIEHYRKALQMRPNFAEVHNSLAVELETTPGAQEEAIAHYEEAIRLRPKFAHARANLARMLSAIPSRRGEAHAHFEEALLRIPGDPSANYFYARLLAATSGRETDALRHYAVTLQALPSAAEAHAGVAGVLARMPGTLDQAVQHFETAIRLQPAAAEFRTQYGNALASAGRFADALPHFEAAVRLAPLSPASHYNLANTLARLPGRIADAILHYKEALRLSPDSAEIYGNLANVIALQPGRLDEALRLYERALELNPNLPWVHYNLGMYLAQLPDRTSDALAHAAEAVRLDPANPAARSLLERLRTGTQAAGTPR